MTIPLIFSACIFGAVFILIGIRDERVSPAVAGVLVILAGLGIGIPGHIAGEQAAKDHRLWVVDEGISISSLANTSEIRGEIHGGRWSVDGEIDEKNVIRYLKTHDDGGTSLEEMTLDSNDVRFYEDAKDGAHLDVEKCTVDSKSITGFASWFAPTGHCGTRYRVHLPEGSLATDYVVSPAA